jgi:hypothetical protein
MLFLLLLPFILHFLFIFFQKKTSFSLLPFPPFDNQPIQPKPNEIKPTDQPRKTAFLVGKDRKREKRRGQQLRGIEKKSPIPSVSDCTIPGGEKHLETLEDFGTER